MSDGAIARFLDVFLREKENGAAAVTLDKLDLTECVLTQVYC